MGKTSSPQSPKRNPLTYRAHRRETQLQIVLPLVIGGLILLALAFWVGTNFNSTGEITRWAQVSAIWLAIPFVFLSMIVLLTLVGLIYAVAILLKVLPPYGEVAYQFFCRVYRKTSAVTATVVEPVLRWHSIKAGLRALLPRR